MESVYFRIIGKVKEDGQAYAEPLTRIKVLDMGLAYVEDINGFGCFTDIDSIVLNPEIVRVLPGGRICKIKLEV